MKQEKISTGQFFIFVILFTTGGSILITPPFLTLIARQDAWIAGLLTIVVGMILVAIYMKLSEHYPDRHLFEMCDILLGKWFGKLMSILFLLYILLLSALLLENMANFLRVKILPGTPKEIFYITFLMTVVVGIYSGLETSARAAQVLFPILIFLYAFATILTFPNINMKEFLPVFEYGPKPILHASYNFLAFPFLQLIFLNNIIPQLNNQKKTKKFFFIGMIIGGIVHVTETFLAISILGVDLTIENVYPTYLINKKINVFNFFQRMEVLIAFFWTITILFKIILCFYSFIIGFTYLLRLNNLRPFILPLSTILLVCTVFLTPNVMAYNEFNRESWPIISWIIGFIFPIILLLVSFIRRKKNKLHTTTH